jgi:hypothetical protein
VERQHSAQKSNSRLVRSIEAKDSAPTWDEILNTNNTLIITDVIAMKVTGSN